MLHWISDISLIFAQWAGRSRQLNRLGQIGLNLFYLAVIAPVFVCGSTADNDNFLAVWWWILKMDLYLFAASGAFFLLGAIKTVLQLRRQYID